MSSAGLVNHWIDMPEWSPSRELWAFYLTFGQESLLHSAVRNYHGQMKQTPGLDTIEAEWLHLTLQGIAFSDEVGNTSIAAITELLAPQIAQTPIPTLTAQRLEVDLDSIIIPVAPTQPLTELRQLIRDTASTILGPSPLYQLPGPRIGFAPHISLAYAYSSVSEAALASLMESLKPVPVDLNVKHLSLIRLKREPRRWSWSYERRLPFSAGERRKPHGFHTTSRAESCP